MTRKGDKPILRIISAVCGIILLGMMVFWFSMVQVAEPCDRHEVAKEPDHKLMTNWYVNENGGVVMVYASDSGGKLEFLHPTVGNPQLAPYVDEIIYHDGYFWIWSRGGNNSMKYTVQNEPIMVRFIQDWKPSVAKTFDGKYANDR